MRFEGSLVCGVNLAAITVPPLVKLNAVLQSISLLLAIAFTVWNWRRKVKKVSREEDEDREGQE